MIIRDPHTTERPDSLTVVNDKENVAVNAIFGEVEHQYTAPLNRTHVMEVETEDGDYAVVLIMFDAKGKRHDRK